MTINSVAELAAFAAKKPTVREVVTLIRIYAETERDHLARIDEEERLKIIARNQADADAASKTTLKGLLVRVTEDANYDRLDATLRADIEAEVG